MPFVDEILPLYQAVFGRAKQRFEELNRSYFCQLGQRMNDRSRFLFWWREKKIVAFASCLVHGGDLKGNYIVLGFSLALEYYLYFVTWLYSIILAFQNFCFYYYNGPLN